MQAIKGAKLNLPYPYLPPSERPLDFSKWRSVNFFATEWNTLGQV